MTSRDLDRVPPADAPADAPADPPADPPADLLPHLHADTCGAGPRLVLVHGFTQTRRCWGALPAVFQRDHQLLCVDLPGHGRSPAPARDLPDAARRLGATAGQAIYLGYSLGGRVCLHLALACPTLVRALILVGATPGIDDPAARDDRAAADDRLADHLERIGVPAFLDEWLAQPLFRDLRPDAQDRAARAESTASGLAAALRTLGTGRQEPLWPRLHTLTMPVLVVAGARDEKFATLGARMATAIGPHAHLALIPDAGHAAHLEQPAAFTDLVQAWLHAHAAHAPHDLPYAPTPS